MRYRLIRTRLSRLLIVADDRAIRRVQFAASQQASTPEPGWRSGGPLADEAARQLRAYLKGDLRIFDLPVAPDGTPFEQRVWSQLQKIPYGETMSYGEVARRIGQRRAARAVGAAARKNPVCILIPCHRVVGRDGSLTGFASGLERKAQLLALERRHEQ